jgi:hypothetical protein
MVAVALIFFFGMWCFQEENETVQKRRADPDSDEITWEEYKSMKFTSHVWP